MHRGLVLSAVEHRHRNPHETSGWQLSGCPQTIQEAALCPASFLPPGALSLDPAVGCLEMFVWWKIRAVHVRQVHLSRCALCLHKDLKTSAILTGVNVTIALSLSLELFACITGVTSPFSVDLL